MFSWDPSVYSEFETERTRPAIDLLSRISHLRPRSIIDVGCGPGNSTELLARAFPDAEIIGIDTSPEMVASAAERLPGIEFEVMDALLHPMDSEPRHAHPQTHGLVGIRRDARSTAPDEPG